MRKRLNWVICSAGEVSVGKKGPPISKDGRGAGDVSPPQNPRCSCRFCCCSCRFCCCCCRSAHRANGKTCAHLPNSPHHNNTPHLCQSRAQNTAPQQQQTTSMHTYVTTTCHQARCAHRKHHTRDYVNSRSVPNRSTRIPAAAPGPLSHTRPHRLTPTVSSRVAVAAPGPQTHTTTQRVVPTQAGYTYHSVPILSSRVCTCSCPWTTCPSPTETPRRARGPGLSPPGICGATP